MAEVRLMDTPADFRRLGVSPGGVEPWEDQRRDGLGADLEVASLASPYRPGTAYFGFDDEHYYTWLCAVPKADVAGTITVDGKRIDVHGRGYHDHQWGNANLLTLWNHWLWARQSYDDYTMLVFDMVAQERYGFQRFPICFIQDADGRLVFENTHDVSYELLDSYVDEKTGKDYPKASRYTSDHDGSHVVYTVTADKALEVRDAYHEAPEEVQKLYDRAGLHPSYSRYAATGDLELTDAGGAVERSAGLIYEFMYPGRSFREHI